MERKCFRVESAKSTNDQPCLSGSFKKIIKTFGYQTDDCLVILAEAMAIREAIKVTIQIGMPKVMVASDSRVTINFILSQLGPELIRNLIVDIRSYKQYYNFQF